MSCLVYKFRREWSCGGCGCGKVSVEVSDGGKKVSKRET